MPAVIALFVRALIQFAITIGIVELAERFAFPLLNRAIEGTIRFFGVDEEEAKDIVANEYILAAESLGVGALTLRAKTPTKIAERLGFTSKGFSKRKLKPATENKVSKAKGQTKLPTVINPQNADEVLTAVAESRGFLGPKAKDLITLISVGIGLPTGVAFTVAQYIDFGSWESGAYTTQFQKILKNFGLEPDKAMPSSKVLSKDMWNRIKSVYETDGAVAINDPYKNATVLFNTENLIDIVDKVATDIVTNGASPTFKNVIAATTGFIVRKAATPTTQKPSGVSPSPVPIQVQPLKITKPTFKATADELTNIALGKVADFLESFPARLDFELTTRNNPIDETGKFLSGKYYTLQIKLRSGQFGQTKLHEAVLRPLAEGEKALKPDEEEPFESALRQAAGIKMTTDSIAVIAPSASPESSTVPATPRELSHPPEVADSLLRYAVWDGDFILDFKADVHLPPELINPKNPQSRSIDIGGDTLQKLRADIKKWTGENDQIVEFIGDTITEYQRTDFLRGRLNDPGITGFGGHEKVSQEFGGIVELGLFLLNKRRKRGTANQTATGRPLHVRFQTSPDVFDRRTGRYISFAEAKQLDLFKPGAVEELPTKRPEVTNVTDIGVWSGKDLTEFPV